MDHSPHDFLRLVRHPLKFRLFLLGQLPSAYFSGVRVIGMDENKCKVKVPYKWFTRNPFRSTYFACLAMAGEMSTGALGLAYLYKRNPPVSMLVVSVKAHYYKKATGITIFTCEDGNLFDKMISEAISTGETRTVEAKSAGRNKEGELIAEMVVTWSFKMKKRKTENGT
jgi:hypothetical protein